MSAALRTPAAVTVIPNELEAASGRVHKRDMGGYFRTVDERYSPHLRRDLLKHFHHFPPIAVSKFWKPVIFPRQSPGSPRNHPQPDLILL